MKKVLTVSIAAYNVQEYIERALDSCVKSYCNDIEVLVIDDGSTDNTDAIVQRYEKEYPDIIRLIKKDNGGYGSTVNTSLQFATGKYFRLLDGDDWFDSALSELIKSLRSADVDIAISPYVVCGDDSHRVVDQANEFVCGCVDIDNNTIPRLLSMHSISYRTALIRESHLKLPLHRLYTDTLYNVIPLQLTKTALISHLPVYCYRVGREGQSVSNRSLELHRADMLALVYDLFDKYNLIDKRDTPQARVMREWLVNDATWYVRIISGMRPTREHKMELMSFLEFIHQDSEVYERCLQSSKVFRTIAMTPKVLYPISSIGYHLVRKVTGS